MKQVERINFFVIVLPKVIGIVTKFFKTFKVLKVSLAGASFVGYAFLTTWEFSAILIAALFVHEMGHVLAMRWYGIRIRGMYFIPFLGAVIATDDETLRRDDWKNMVVSIAGPAVGSVPAVVGLIFFLFVPDPRIAVAVAWVASINLFNLLPLSPLDGGHVMDVLMRSDKAGFRFALRCGLLALSFFLGVMGAFYFLLFAVLYLLESLFAGLLVEKGDRPREWKGGLLKGISKGFKFVMKGIIVALLIGVTLMVVIILGSVYAITLCLLGLFTGGKIWLPNHLWVVVAPPEEEKGFPLRVVMSPFLEDVWLRLLRRIRKEVRAPKRVRVYRRLRDRTPNSVPQRPLSSWQRVTMVAAYAILTITLTLFFTKLESVPGADLARQMLLDGVVEDKGLEP